MSGRDFPKLAALWALHGYVRYSNHHSLYRWGEPGIEVPNHVRIQRTDCFLIRGGGNMGNGDRRTEARGIEARGTEARGD